MNELINNKVQSAFRERFGNPELAVKAPGRINLIGEHTDYNDGFVLPASVSHSIYFSMGRSADPGVCTLFSLDFDEEYVFELSEMRPLPKGSWQNYLLGVIAEMQHQGHVVPGFNLVFSGDIPQGAGMSSSAALECGFAMALDQLFDLGYSRVELVKICQMAEHHYAKVKCGIMDQFASMMGKEDHVILLDCRSLEYQYFPVQLDDFGLLLCNSNVSHSLASSEYNTRRAQCEEGVEVLQQEFPELHSLRDASIRQLETVKSRMNEIVFKRCHYVIEENDRVVRFSRTLKEKNLVEAGNILQTAQAAMRHEYEISCPEIDFMADFANKQDAVLGARMMGGGFGGCTINLLRKSSIDQFIDELSTAYRSEFDNDITPIEIRIDHGVSLI